MSMPTAAGSGAGLNSTAPGPATTPQHALEGLRRAILTGQLRPGQRVAQEDIAGRLGVSIAPVREALRTLEHEGQVVHRPRRGYFVTALEIRDLEEIYELRSILEAHAARRTLQTLDDDVLERIIDAARDCDNAVNTGDGAAEREANRRFHFAILDSPGQTHTMRLIRLLWDSTESYRALYFNAPDERRNSIEAHGQIIEALRDRDPDQLVAELDAHRNHALGVLRDLLARATDHPHF
jgi:DNA-binding GntR family transcriptional regulator